MVNESFIQPSDPVMLFRSVIEGSFAGISCDVIESLIMRGDLQSATTKVFEMEQFFSQIFTESQVADAVRNASGMLMVIRDYKLLLNDAFRFSDCPSSVPHKPSLCWPSDPSANSSRINTNHQRQYSPTSSFVLVNRIC